MLLQRNHQTITSRMFVVFVVFCKPMLDVKFQGNMQLQQCACLFQIIHRMFRSRMLHWM